jgi:hypothetical protein
MECERECERRCEWEWECSVGPEGLDEREELLSVLVCMDVFVCEASTGLV